MFLWILWLYVELNSNIIVSEKTGISRVISVWFSVSVSSSSSQSEIRSGRSVTLFCQLYYDRVSCDYLVSSESIKLIWANQADVNLKTDYRFQILSSGRCNISLTTTLLNEDHNREWRCQVKQRNQVKTSVTYTVKYSGKWFIWTIKDQSFTYDCSLWRIWTFIFSSDRNKDTVSSHQIYINYSSYTTRYIINNHIS